MALDVLLVVHALGVLLRLTLGLLLVEPILTLCLGELIDLGACKASNELLSEGVRDRLAYISVSGVPRWVLLERRTFLALVVFKGLEAGKGSASGYDLVAEAGLVLLEVVIVVDLLVAVLALVYSSFLSTTYIEVKTKKTYPRNPL